MSKITAKRPGYPLKLEDAGDSVPEWLKDHLSGIYKTSDPDEAVTLASMEGFFIWKVVFDGVHPEVWYVGVYKDWGWMKHGQDDGAI